MYPWCLKMAVVNMLGPSNLSKFSVLYGPYHIIFQGIDTKLDSDKQFLKKETLENLLKGVRAHVEMVDSKFYSFMVSTHINKQLQQVNSISDWL